MQQKLSYLFSRWVLLNARYGKTSLCVIILLSVAAAIFSHENFRVNSDLGKLILPSEKTRWYSDNEIFKQQFPEYQDTALVLVAGDSVADVQATAKKLYAQFSQEPSFKDVFAPQFSDFFNDRVLLAIPLEGVKRIAEATQESLQDLQGLSQSPSIERYLALIDKKIDADKSQQFLSRDSKNAIDAFNQTLESLANKQTVQPLRQVIDFLPEDDGDVYYALISLKSQQQFSAESPNAEVVKKMRQVISQVVIPAGVKVTLSGEIMLGHEEISAAMSGVELAGLLSLLLLAVVLGVGIRSWSIIIAIFAMLGLGSLLTTALGLLTVGSFNTLSLVFLVMFFGLGVDFAVHFCLKVAEDMSLTEGDMLRSLEYASKDLSLVLLLCALTSSIAFLAFLPTAYKGLAELGIISAGGMLVALLLSLSFFPAWFSVFGLKYAKATGEQAALLETTAVVAPSDAPRPGIKKRWPLLILLLSVLLSAYCFSLMDQLRFDFSVLALRDKNSEGMQTLLALQEKGLITDYSVNVLVQEPNAEALESLKQQLLALDEVRSIYDISDVLPKFQALKQAYMQPVAEQLNTISVAPAPAVNDAATTLQIQHSLAVLNLPQQDIFIDNDESKLQRFSQALQTLDQQPVLYAALQAQVAAGVRDDVQQLQRWFSQARFGIDDFPKDLRDRFISDKGYYLLTVLPEKELSERDDMQAFVEAVAAVAPNVSGRSVVEWGVGQVVVEAFGQAVTIAIVLIGLLLLLYFKSLRLSVLVMIPLLLTTLFTFAIVVLTGLSLNMANILVVPLIFGLGIDTGMHVVHRYFSSSSLREFYLSSTSKAVLISALTTIGTFLSLSLSAHKGAQSVGILLAVGLSLMLLLSFTLLPALLELLLKPTMLAEKKHS